MSRFFFDKQDELIKRVLLECFAQKLEEHLGKKEPPKNGSKRRSPPPLDRRAVMKDVGDAVNITLKNVKGAPEFDQKLDVRQFETFLKKIYPNYLKFPVRLDYDAAVRVKQRMRDTVREITVVAGTDQSKFAQAAAECFIKQLYEVGVDKPEKSKQEETKDWLNVGIVSGSTIGSTIRAADELDWRELLGKNVEQLPKIRVLALNVCLTTHKYLSDNANILAHLLSNKINKTLGHGHAEAYGLSAPLLVEYSKLRETDNAPQNKDVVQWTEPNRLMPSPRPDLADDETKLDIVLTGVGELPGLDPSGEGSIFYKLSDEFGFNMKEMVNVERIVGDIAFSAITSGGEWVPLRDKYRKTEVSEMGANSQAKNVGSKEWMFYSAVRLRILEKMACDDKKRVILVARKAPGKSKAPAIFASVARGHRYATHLIIDEDTALELRQA
jgi:hypothetical protein